MNAIFRILVLAAWIGIAVVVEASATTVYYNDFQMGAVGSEWSSTLTDSAPNGEIASWGRFLGQFSGNQSAKLSLSGLPRGMVTLSFDTYFIRSWDGNGTDYGPDTFKVTLGNGLTLLDATFSNGNPGGQSYVGNGIEAPAYAGSGNNSMIGSSQQFSLGYFFDDAIRDTREGMDSVYSFSFSFLNTIDAALEVVFAGMNLQDNLVFGPDGTSYYDESWGLDNVRVEVAAAETTPIPEPGTFLLLTGGVMAASFFRGRRRRACGRREQSVSCR